MVQRGWRVLRVADKKLCGQCQQDYKIELRTFMGKRSARQILHNET